MSLTFAVAAHLGRWAAVYNYVEVGLWPAIGLVLILNTFRSNQMGRVARRDCIIAAIVLIVFGASDWFEVNNANEWWRPWWLLLWKASCVLALALLGFRAWKRRGDEKNWNHEVTKTRSTAHRPAAAPRSD